MRTYYRPSRRVKQPSDEWATAFEKAVLPAQLRAGQPPMCVHLWVAPWESRVDINERQAAGVAACIERQRAALAAEPLDAKDQPDGLMDT
jgi:hypothetical protein